MAQHGFNQVQYFTTKEMLFLKDRTPPTKLLVLTKGGNPSFIYTCKTESLEQITYRLRVHVTEVASSHGNCVVRGESLETGEEEAEGPETSSRKLQN